MKICPNFNLPASEVKKVILEVESHTGLFLQSGFMKYEFVHKSIQEYLAAEYIVKLPSLEYLKEKIDVMGAELAIATSISSNPSLFFSDLVLNRFSRAKLPSSFRDAFVSRLILEKPDFYPSDDVVLSCLSLVSESLDNNLLIDFATNLIKDQGKRVVLKNYELSSIEGDFCEFKRKRRHSKFMIPNKLRLPKRVCLQ